MTGPLCALLQTTRKECGLIFLTFAFVTYLNCTDTLCRSWGIWCDFWGPHGVII